MAYDLFDSSKGEKVVRSFKIIYGAGDSLEPFYYRILYCLRQNRAYQTIKKVQDYYNISPNTQQFGFATQNLRQELSTVSGFLGQIGQVVKGIVGMKKDHQRIKECLSYYNENGKPNDQILKGIWADFVDSKTGPASLTQAAQKLEFFVARDWFFRIKNRKELEKFKKEIPGNLMTFLERKFGEYEHWFPEWKSRLEEMDSTIADQVKASEQSVNLYKDWIKPLLKNVEALKLAPDPLNADLLKIGGAMYSQVKIVAWGKTDPRLKEGRMVFDYVPAKAEDLSKPDGKKGKALYNGKQVPFMPFIEITLTLRTGAQQYMETVVEFKSKIMDIKRFEELYYNEWVKDLADVWVDNLMLKERLGESVKEEKKKEESNDVLGLLGKKMMGVELPGIFKKWQKKKKEQPTPQYKIDALVSKASKALYGDLMVVYYVTKKSFGMLADFAMYR